MLKNIIYLFAVSLILLGCKTSKPLSGKVSKDVSVRQLTKIHEKSFPAIKTLQARLRGSYTSKEESQSIAISARIEKDKAIWLSAKLAGIIPLAKVYITPNRVQYYEKIDQTYFDGDFELLSEWLNLPVDFDQVQNLLLGQAMLTAIKGKYDLLYQEKEYKLTAQLNAFLSQTLLINPAHFRLNAQHYHNLGQAESIRINYPEYQKINDFWFPKKIDIQANKVNENTQIEIDYRSIEVNKPVSFPFEIPKGYKAIKLP